MTTHLFAVERYGSQSESPAVPPALPLPGPARLIGVLQLTDDDVGMALVEGPDPETVRASMTDAGWRVDRVTSAAWVVPPAGAGS
jgi:hypothetical protein